MTHLTFRLNIEDDWPPVAAECLPCSTVGSDFRVEAAPLFVPDLSKGDLIRVALEDHGQVFEWSHLRRSTNSTIWLMTVGGTSIDETLATLHDKGCSTTRFAGFNIGALDIPQSVLASDIDEALAQYTEDQLAVAYSSWRHD